MLNEDRIEQSNFSLDLSLSKVFETWENKWNQKNFVQDYSFEDFNHKEQAALKGQGFDIYQGKVRDCLSKNGKIYMVHSDRLSAFDRIVGKIPFKGILLTSINHFWLNKCQVEVPVCPFRKIGKRVLEMEKLDSLKFEVIVRGYLAGSMLRAYKKGKRDFCDNKLPDKLRDWQELPQLIITPTTKADQGMHDEDIRPDEIIESKLCTSKQWDEISSIALKLFAIGQKVYQSKGWILVDTKYEFGINSKGDVFVIDEIHTPDSSRLWVEQSYRTRVENNLQPEMLDKEIIRSYLMEKKFTGNGEIPHIPPQKIASLSRSYYHVAEKLIGSEIRVPRSMEIEKKELFEKHLNVI